VLVLASAACRSRPDSTITLPEGDDAPAASLGEEPPVPVNANSPVVYPAAFLRERIEGTVILRLFLDSTGAIQRDSTRIAESSGYPALDSAALAAVPTMQFAPALRRGDPVATAFLQPVHFRNPVSPATP
jgi:protein TonB